VIGGWFCPVVNFWFPKQIVDDVIAASDPRTPPLFPDLRRLPRHGLVLAWWLTWVATAVMSNVGPTDLASDIQDVSQRAVGAIVSTLGVLLTAVCAVLAIRVVRLVTACRCPGRGLPAGRPIRRPRHSYGRPSICSKSKELV
jgi:hypothetical protein